MDDFEQAMEPIYQYVDTLAAPKKDAVVRAQEWETCGVGVGYDPDGPGCLVNHAEGRGTAEVSSDEVTSFIKTYGTVPGDIGLKFDTACRRFGKDRVVRAIKLRAGATLSDLPQPEREAVGAG